MTVMAVLALPASALGATVERYVRDDTGLMTAYGVSYQADAGEANRLVVEKGRGRDYLVRDAGATIRAGAGCRRVDAHTAACRVPGPQQASADELTLTARLGGRNDTFRDGSGLAGAAVNGGAGDDELRAPRAGGLLNGGTGRDRLLGGDGADRLRGGDVRGNVDPDVLDGDPGEGTQPSREDVADYGGRARGVRVDLAAGRGGLPGEGDRLSGVEAVVGTRGDDVLLGDGQANRLSDTFGPTPSTRSTGDDRMEGRGGRDTLQSSTGADRLYGGADTDVVELNYGPARAYGGDGPDVLSGNKGRVRLSGGPDDDTIQTFRGARARLSGDTGDDRLFGTLGFQALRGGAGDDRLQGSMSGDALDGGAGADTLIGDRARTYRYQAQERPGRDRLVGGPGVDELYAGPEDDTLLSRDGTTDTVDGGSGEDRARVDPVDLRVSIEALF